MPSNHEHNVHDGIRKYLLLSGAIKLILILLSIGCLVILALTILFLPEQRTELIGAEHYEKYIGTNNDSKVSDFINSFFPEKLDQSFSDIIYIYRATDFGSYACEAYLEFTIADKRAFTEYVSGIIQNRQWKVFCYDSNYMESCFTDSLYLSTHCSEQEKNGADNPVSITDAQIGRILYSAEEQKVIFSAILVSNDSVVETEYFNLFFNRFNIDPTEYTDNISFID